mgnify:CR=1 FL=1
MDARIHTDCAGVYPRMGLYCFFLGGGRTHLNLGSARAPISCRPMFWRMRTSKLTKLLICKRQKGSDRGRERIQAGQCIVTFVHKHAHTVASGICVFFFAGPYKARVTKKRATWVRPGPSAPWSPASISFCGGSHCQSRSIARSHERSHCARPRNR